jgi:ribosomal protein L31
MSGTSTSKFTASGTVPNQEALGHYHRFKFDDTNPHVKLQAYSQYVPTSNNTSTINIETRNHNYSGFRWHHTTQSTDVNSFGSFAFQSFVGDGEGVNVIGFNGSQINMYFPVYLSGLLDMGTHVISSLSPGVAGTDAVNLNQLSTAVSGAITLTGDVTGSGVLGTPFAATIVSKLNQIPVATGAVNINSQNLISVGNVGIGVASPVNGIEFAGVTGNCKICLFRPGGITNDFQIFGFGITASTLKYTVNSSSSDHVFYCGASSTTSTELLRIGGTGLVNISGNLGINVASPSVALHFANVVADCKIALYRAANNFQVYGFGVLGNTLKYSVDSSASSHVFYCGASSTTSTELFRIAGAGYATVSGGSGTFYSRVPSATWAVSTNASGTVVSANTWTKASSSSSLSGPAVQFTVATNRLTFSGSDLSADCDGMFSASAVLTHISGTPKLGLAVYLNGTNRLGCQAYVSPTAAGNLYNLSITPTLCTLSPGDYLEIWVLSSTATTITASEMSLSFSAC